MNTEDRRWIWLLALLFTAVVVVRLSAADNDLWLDEIWTLEQVRPLQSVLGVFTDIKEENHALYTLWAYLLGPEVSAQVYRLPALLAGLFAVLLAARIAVLQSGEWLSAVFAVTLVGFSYLGIHYGTEARGYAPSTAFVLLALAALLHGIDRPQARWRVLFGGALCLAFVAQPMAVNFLAAATAWIPVRQRKQIGVRRALADSAGWLAVPSAFFVAYYVLYLRHLETGGGPDNTLFEICGNALAYTFGLPTTLGSLGLNPLGGVILLAGLVTLIRERNDLWILYLVGCVLAPLTLIILRGSTLIYERYFVASAALALLMTSHALTRLWRRAPRIVTALIVIAFLAGNVAHAVPLLRDGRGEPTELIRRVAAETDSAEIRYSANHPFRVRMVIDHYARRAAPGRTLRYVEPVDKPEWVIKSLLEPRDAVDRVVRSPDGQLFRLAFIVPSAPMSGFWFAAYRRAG